MLRRVLVVALPLLAIALCTGHTALRLLWTPGAWPAPRAIPELAWIAARLGGVRELGLVQDGLALGELPGDLDLRLYRVQHAVAPAYLVRSPRDVALVVFAERADREELAARLAEQGYPELLFGPEDGIALASRTPLPEPAPPPLRERAPLPAALALVALLGIPLAIAARRGGSWAAALTAVGAPGVLGVAAALADLTSVPASATLALYVAGVALWLWVAVPLRAPPVHAGSPDGARSRRTLFAAATVLVVILGLAAGAIRCGAFPDGGWDAQAMYGMRARFIVLAESFAAPFADVEGFRELHGDYPPLVPFALAGGWRLVGGATPLVAISIQAALWLGSSAFLALWARRAGGRLLGLAVLALLVLSPFWHDRLAAQECDLPVASLLASALLAWHLGRDARAAAQPDAWRWSLVSGVLLGLTALTKNEGALLAACWTGLLMLEALRAPRERLPELAPLAAGLLPLAALLVAFQAVAPANDLVAAFDLGRATGERARAILRRFASLAVRPQEFRGVFALAVPAAAVALVAGAIAWWRGERGPRVFRAQLAGLLLLAGLAFFAAYVATPYDLGWHLSTSASRVLAQLYPVAILLGASLLAGVRRAG